MSFVSPFTALATAAVTVPLLLLLYFLKLRRRPLRIASTLLWSRTFEDLQVNAPFQRLRWSLLLLVQMLLLLTLLLALAQPRLDAGRPAATRVILMIDNSASMNATDMDTHDTRLEAAKDDARRLVERLGRGTAATQMMIITFAASAQVACGFDSRQRVLMEAIDSIGPTDEEANLDAALQLAGAFASRGEENGEDVPDVVLVSDGGVAPPTAAGGFALRSGRFQYAPVAPTDSPWGNVGFVSLSARRDYDDPAQVMVFARLLNTSAEPIESLVTIEAGGVGVATPVSIPGADADGPGEAPLARSLELPDDAVISIRHGHSDVLAADNTAALYLPPPAQPRIALVHPGDGPGAFLEELLMASDPASLDVMSKAAMDNLDPTEIDTGALYELIVFDRVAPDRLPGVPSVTVGAVPGGIGEIAAVGPEGQRVLSWDRQHPVMRHVSLDTVVYTGFGGLELPIGATTLAQGPAGPIIAVLRTRGARHVVIGFKLVSSNWPLHVSFTVFMQNVLDYLTLAGSGQQGLVSRPGEALTVRAGPETTRITIDDIDETGVAVEPGAVMILPRLRRVGVYDVRGAMTPSNVVAVSMLSEVESDIRPRASIVVNAETAGGADVADTVPLELWPWLVGVAGVLLIIEWLIYCRRMTG